MGPRDRSQRRAGGWRIPAGLVLIALVLLLRIPELLTSPRFWAEEGGHFTHAYLHPWEEALIYTRPRVGYFHLTSNLGAWIAARWLPLEFAPYGTMALALGVQLLPFTLLALSRASIFGTWRKKGFAALLLLFLSTVTTEVWLNTINSQVHYGLAALLILIEDAPRPRRSWRVLAWGTLLLGGLSGPYVCFLAPAFAWRAFATRERHVTISACIAGIVLLVQSLLLWRTLSKGRIHAQREFQLSAETLSQISTDHLGAPFLGRSWIEGSAEAIPFLGGFAFLFLASLFVGLRTWIWLRTGADRRAIGIPLLLAFVTLSCGIGLGALDGRVSGRYAVVPSFLVILALLSFRERLAPGWARHALTGLLCLGLLSGVRGYALDSLSPADPNYSWAAEVEQWHANANHRLAIRPARWTLRLRRRPKDQQGP